MNQELDTTLRQLHASYCELSLRQPPYATCERRWLEWHNAGFGIDDLRLTIAFVQKTNWKRERQYHIPLRFDSFIGDLERFGDLLGEARAERRKRECRAKQSYCEDKASILRATGRLDTKPLPETQQAKEVMEGLFRKGFEQALKEAEESKQVRL